MIQASAQAVAEMKEKIKIVQNEIEILRNESMAKDKSLSVSFTYTESRLHENTGFKWEFVKVEYFIKWMLFFFNK